MLILDRETNRHPDDTIVLTVPPSDEPTEIRVVVVSQKGSHVKLGCDAPDGVVIDRLEVHKRRGGYPAA